MGMGFSLVKKFAKKLVGRNLGKIPLVKPVFYKIFSLSAPRIIETNGMRMYVNPEDRFISFDLILHGFHEKFETELVKRELKRGMTVLDIGANIGYYTLLFSKLVGPEGRVYAFEPEPSNFELLQKNVALNNLKNVTLINKAVSDSVGNTDLFLAEHNIGAHSIFNIRKWEKSIKVGTVSLDKFFVDRGMDIDFIKMDIEGAEYSALRGMENILNNNRKLKLLIEFLVIGLRASGSKPEDLLYFLRNHGFEINLMDENKELVIPVNLEKDMEEVLRQDEKNSQKNLFCVKGV